MQPVPPYGTYRLPRPLAALRRAVASLPAGRGRRLVASGVRRLCMMGRSGPIDVEADGGVRLRLWPRTNRCEKAVLTAPWAFDGPERTVLSAAVAAGPSDRAFVFLDLGANVGLYALSVLAAARAAGRPARVVAVEPDPVNRERLETNLALNGFAAEAVAAAVAAEDGWMRLVPPAGNRGEARVAPTTDAADGDGTVVEARTILSLARARGLERIDALKIDVEGHDRAALAAFLEAAPPSLWPAIVVAEVGRTDASGIADLLVGAGYAVAGRTRLNAIFRFTGAGSTD